MGHLGSQLVRSFATSSASASAAMVKPPITVFGTEGRYAMALFSAASKNKALDAVEKDMDTFRAQLKKDTRLNEFLFDPSVQKSLKAKGLAGACDKLKMNELSKNLFLTMAENGRYSYFGAVATAFKTIMSAHRGEITCEVTTAKPLDAAMTKEVETAIAGFVKAGQKSQINYKVDPSIIGGMVVAIGDRFVDMSMASKLKRYEEIIKSAA
eukprot:TCALIF_05580-PA protein Name:"Similar to Oscp ATP synthase subunit O, mitochondrial (Drosophila melanogaster)" AED:0.05 eAED:0.05 QI:0/0/0/0.66/1/1/3/0/210